MIVGAAAGDEEGVAGSRPDSQALHGFFPWHKQLFLADPQVGSALAQQQWWG